MSLYSCSFPADIRLSLLNFRFTSSNLKSKNMISQFASLNWISILVAFFAYFLLGALWFTLFFKKQYAISLGKENQLPEKPAPIFIIGPAICSLVITIAGAVFIYALNINTIGAATEFALVAGIGFLV